MLLAFRFLGDGGDQAKKNLAGKILLTMNYAAAQNPA